MNRDAYEWLAAIGATAVSAAAIYLVMALLSGGA